MKRTLVLITILPLLSTGIMVPACAQNQMQPANSTNGVSAQRSRRYNRATLDTITGDVVSVNSVSRQGQGYGVHLMVNTGEDTVDVHLGPSWYLDSQNIRFQVGDRLEIKGSRVADTSKPTLIAAEVKRGDQVLVLRDQNGLPAWRGMGRGQWR